MAPSNTEVEVEDNMTEPLPIDVESDAEPELLPGRAYEGETADAKDARIKALGKAYSEATTKLRETHLDEFNDLVIAGAKAAGYDWKPQPTKAQKAKAAIEALLAENPELAEEIEVKG